MTSQQSTPSGAPDAIAADPGQHNPRGLRASTNRTFAAVRIYPLFRRVWIAALAASTGQWMQSTALGWIALDQTGSKAFVGLVACVAGIPFFIISIPGGALLDRFDRRRVLMICQAAAAVFALFVAAGVLLGWTSPAFLLGAAFINGSIQAILSPSQQALVPRIVDREHLTNAIGLISAGNSVTRIFGPSLAGVMIGFVGDGETFILQAVALIIGFAAVATASFPPISASGNISGLRNVLAGVSTVAKQPDLRALLLVSSLPPLFVFPYISFIPVFARDVLSIGPQGLGLLMSCSGVGAVTGSLLVAGRRSQTNAGRLILLTTWTYCFFTATFAFSHSVLLSLLLIAIAAGLGAYFVSSTNALMQMRVSDEMRGRVLGTYMLTWGLMPIGALPMGIVAEHFGVQAAVAGGSAICFVATGVIAIAMPVLREI